ncbi:MAG: ice-binding family protein [bacterium]|nr:ice-binding family protein [bacterium]
MKKLNRTAALAATAVFFFMGVTIPSIALAAGPSAINLLSASNFTILSQTGITETGGHTTAITGNIGSSPITAAAMNDVFCSQINGTIYGVNAAYVGSGSQTCFAGNPPLSNKTFVDTAVLDMVTAYNDAAGRTLPDGTELFAGNLGGQTFAPGLYKWSTNVSIPTDVTLSGGVNDVWIFQIAGNLSIASGASVPAGIKVNLVGGAQAGNVFWQVGGGTGATLGTFSTFNGTILSATQVIIQTGAVLNGRALAQTQVTLDANQISTPALVIAPVSVPGFALNSSGTGSSGSGSSTRGPRSDVETTSASTSPAAVVNAVSPTSADIMIDISGAYAPSFPNAGLSGETSPKNMIVFSIIMLSLSSIFAFSATRAFSKR